MTDTSFSITPPPEFVEQWDSECESDVDAAMYLATQAARWGADQELEACIKLLSDLGGDGEMIRRYRRPKPPSLKEQALEILELNNDVDSQLSAVHYNILRRALESLPD